MPGEKLEEDLQEAIGLSDELVAAASDKSNRDRIEPYAGGGRNATNVGVLMIIFARAGWMLSSNSSLRSRQSSRAISNRRASTQT